MQDNWIRGCATKKIPIEEELDLIREAQNGNERSMEKLLIYYDSFVKQVAKKVAWLTGATRIQEDLMQHGRIALFEKTKSYNFEFIEKRKQEIAGYIPARLSSYAYREIKRRMFQEACIALEIVRIPIGTIIKRAHKELDMGGAAEDIAERLGLPVDMVESLARHTSDIDPEMLDIDDEYMDVEKTFQENEETINIRKIWYKLPVAYRMALSLMYVESDLKKRAETMGLTEKELRFSELSIMRDVKKMLG